MNDDAQRWKSKYLHNLEQQEQQEKQWTDRIDLLKRGLVRSSLAAEGSDKAVDQCMQELRELIRTDQSDDGLAALIPRLERTVLDSEQRRQQRIEQSISGLSMLTSQLLALDPPRDVRRELKQFGKRIDERARQSRELPALLAELGMLQGKALSNPSAEPGSTRPGLLQRLFGGNAEPPAETAPPPAPATPETAGSAPPEASAASQPAPSTDAPAPPADLQPVEPAAAIGAQSGDPAFALPETNEPGYSAIAPHVAASLLKLLNELDLPEHHQAQAETLRQRLHSPLNWYELVPVLDDFGVLVLALSDTGHREFARYLKQLNERLSSVLGSLSQAHEGYSDSLQSSLDLDQALREQVSGLQSSVQDATDLPSLKQNLESRLDGLLNTVIEHRRQRDSLEAVMVERMQGLLGKVAEMEQEAQGFRQHIEEQRQKALTDTLTGLPNRAAWNERLELEMARWQRYGGELLLAVLDIDHFKRINDGYGHLAGDKVLKLIASELRKRLRKTDFMARFGGEEFVLLIPGTPMDGGRQLLETLRSAIEACPFHFRGEPVTITLSAGLTAFKGDESTDSAFERADQALYRAKREGRNRVIQA